MPIFKGLVATVEDENKPYRSALSMVSSMATEVKGHVCELRIKEFKVRDFYITQFNLKTHKKYSIVPLTWTFINVTFSGRSVRS